MTDLSGQMTINGADAWKNWGVFLTEDSPGEMTNLRQLLTPGEMKLPDGISYKERAGRDYASKVTVVEDERTVTLRLALYAEDSWNWIANYGQFLDKLREGYDSAHSGWVKVGFPTLKMELECLLVSVQDLEPLTYLWQRGVQAGRFSVTLREPVPTV